MPLTQPTARRLGALFTAAVGVINILSALYPAIPARMEILQDLLPVHLIRGSQTASVLIGFFLVLLADGLRKRRRRALQLVVFLLGAAALLNLTKGLDFEEAIIDSALAFGLVVTRRAYDISSALPAPRRLLVPLGTFGILYYAYVLVGFTLFRHVISPAPTLGGITLEPFRLLAGVEQYHYAGRRAQWFERSVTLLGGLAFLVAAYYALRPLIPRRHVTGADLHRVRRIVRQHGTDTLSYFAFQHGRSYFFDESGEAFLSYRLWRTVAIVGGHPVGPDDRVAGLLASFLQYCDDSGLEPCFLAIGSRELGTYGNLGLRTLKIGEEALVDLPGFDAANLKRKVRRAARHAEDLGISFQLSRRDTLSRTVVEQMHEISRRWVEARGGNERGFSMTLGRLPEAGDRDCEIALAMQGDRVCGYLCLVPAYQGNSWSLDAMRRVEDAPNGLMEFLVIRTAETLRDRGCGTLSLNFATLSNCQNDIDSRALDTTRRFLYDHLSTVYQLKSLEQFNGKFQPRWHSRYLAYRDVLKIPRLAIAIAQSEDPIKLPTPLALFRR